MRVPTVDLQVHPPAPAALALLTDAFCAQHGIVPIAVHGKTFVVAAARPEDVAMREEVRVVTGLAIEVVHADGELVDRVRRAAYGRPS